MNLICPVCAAILTKEAGHFRCSANHSFDMAKDGYVNLLIRKGKVAAFEGDSLEMLKARRDFLEEGQYAPLTSRLTDLVSGSLSSNGVVLDAGCGEGHYLGSIMPSCPWETIFYGSDISKPAISMAARKHSRPFFFVADTNIRIPLENASVDVILNVFAPRNGSEFSRILKPGGKLIVAMPSANHLASLRERFKLLGVEEGKSEKLQQKLPEFVLDSEETLECGLNLSPESALKLVRMTPNARFVEEEFEAGKDDIETLASFQILLFTKRL